MATAYCLCASVEASTSKKEEEKEEKKQEDEGDEVSFALGLPLSVSPASTGYIFTKCGSMYQPPASSMQSYVVRQLIA